MLHWFISSSNLSCYDWSIVLHQVSTVQIINKIINGFILRHFEIQVILSNRKLQIEPFRHFCKQKIILFWLDLLFSNMQRVIVFQSVKNARNLLQGQLLYIALLSTALHYNEYSKIYPYRYLHQFITIKLILSYSNVILKFYIFFLYRTFILKHIQPYDLWTFE